MLWMVMPPFCPSHNADTGLSQENICTFCTAARQHICTGPHAPLEWWSPGNELCSPAPPLCNGRVKELWCSAFSIIDAIKDVDREVYCKDADLDREDLNEEDGEDLWNVKQPHLQGLSTNSSKLSARKLLVGGLGSDWWQWFNFFVVRAPLWLFHTFELIKRQKNPFQNGRLPYYRSVCCGVFRQTTSSQAPSYARWLQPETMNHLLAHWQE